MEQKNQDLVKAVETHIEPLLHDAKPFFGGSENLTMAEVSTVILDDPSSTGMDAE